MSGTYTGIDLSFNGVDNLVNPSPLVLVLSAALNHAEGLQDIDDVVNSSPLHSKLLRALVQVEDAAGGGPVQEQESAAELTQTFLFPVIGGGLCTVNITFFNRFAIEIKFGSHGERGLRDRNEICTQVRWLL